jgi:hypothetical protein
MPKPKITMAFSAPQVEYLRSEAARLGISVADVVRRIIDKKREQDELRPSLR